MDHKNSYINAIKNNDKKFMNLILKAKNQMNEAMQLLFVQEAYIFATTHCVSAFVAPILENILLDISKKHNISLSPTSVHNSVLHVLTSAYKSGGHTRCVERWIDATGNIYKNSCVLLRQLHPVPETLKNIVAKNNGKLFIFNPFSNLLFNSLKLRKLASFFQFVVLHVHPDDPIPVLAFGNQNFNNPVIFFNHANHVIFSGSSISDMVLELNEKSLKLSKNLRQIENNLLIGFPPDKNLFDAKLKHIYLTKENDKIIFISGSPDKFNTLNKNLIFEVLKNILSKDRECKVVIAGPDSNDVNFHAIQELFPERIDLRGRLCYDKEWKLLLLKASVVIDSWPVPGGATRIDAISAGVPVLSLDEETPDFLYGTDGLCANIYELEKRTLMAINDKNYAESLWISELANISGKSDPHQWRKKIIQIFSSLPKKHTTKYLNEKREIFGNYDYILPVCNWIEPNITKRSISKIKIRNFFKFIFNRLIFIINLAFSIENKKLIT